MQPTIHRGLTALAAALLLSAGTATAETMVTVNGAAITSQDFDLYNARRPNNNEPPEAILDEMVTVELLYQASVKSGLDQNPEFLAEVELQRRNMLASLAVDAFITANPIPEEVVRAEYDVQMAKLQKFEFKARHILLETEEAAREVIAELDGGADFAELAKEKSTGPSGANGGDLGWFSPERMVKPFADAVIAGVVGGYGSEPVQTDFGWHVILVEDKRDLELPEYERTAGQIREVLTGEKIRAYLLQLRDDADISIN